jgi:hypothetical protein
LPVKIECYDIQDRKVLFELPKNGELTPQMRWVLMNGHCHSFALALNKLAKWPIVAKHDSDAIIHVYCRRPKPKALVDAGGTIPIRGTLSRNFRPLTDYRLLETDGWLKPEVDLVMPFAESRLKEIESEDNAGCAAC